MPSIGLLQDEQQVWWMVAVGQVPANSMFGVREGCTMHRKAEFTPLQVLLAENCKRSYRSYASKIEFSMAGDFGPLLVPGEQGVPFCVVMPCPLFKGRALAFH